MDPLQAQVTSLNRKVDGLYQLIEQLYLKVAETKPECGVRAELNLSDRCNESNGALLVDNERETVSMTHKDILQDGNQLEGGDLKSNRELAPEIQIQRLTAQLTAAYNRIAALEEQLLAQRIH
jgi:hypothetical protein